ncbi:unnamed protein product, partial [marine sediment metagenome]
LRENLDLSGPTTISRESMNKNLYRSIMEKKEMSENEGHPLDGLKKQLQLLGEERDATPMLFYTSGNIDYYKASSFLKILRNEPSIENLDLILDSGGGELTMAVKIASICKNYSTKFTVIVPFYAKSAATMIALSADDLILGKAGELGPIDPQVKHPTSDTFIPASSIKNALAFIESSNDPYIKITMADKLDPLLIGAYNMTIDEARQYLVEIPNIKNSENKQQMIDTFTKKYVDHGFPITQEICRSLNFDFSFEFDNDEIENMIYDIHDTVLEFMEDNGLESLILTPNNAFVGIYD